MENKTCCVFGNRTINETEELKRRVSATIERLIIDENVGIFLFGSKSRFDSLCLGLVTRIKEKYPHIKRVYVRSEYPDISDSYKEYLMKSYDDTYYPEKIINAGKAVYVKRNYEMTDKSGVCIVYYEESAAPATRKSGSKIALNYAQKKGKKIIIFHEYGWCFFKAQMPIIKDKTAQTCRFITIYVIYIKRL